MCVCVCTLVCTFRCLALKFRIHSHILLAFHYLVCFNFFLPVHIRFVVVLTLFCFICVYGSPKHMLISHLTFVCVCVYVFQSIKTYLFFIKVIVLVYTYCVLLHIVLLFFRFKMNLNYISQQKNHFSYCPIGCCTQLISFTCFAFELFVFWVCFCKKFLWAPYLQQIVFYFSFYSFLIICECLLCQL